MWNWLGIISSSLFLMVTPEVQNISHNHYTTILNEKVVCGQIDDVHYCISKMNKSSDKMVYFFPGILHNQYAWFYQRKNLKLRKIFFTDYRKTAPTVITISVDPFFIANVNESQTLQIFSKILPEIEEIHHLQPKERIFYGNSLGAFNAFEFAYLSSQSLNSKLSIEKLILGCPLIPTQNPFSDFYAQKNYFWNQQPHSFGFLVRFLAQQFFLRAKFKDSSTWQSTSPLELAYEKDMKHFPETLITGGRKDEFHFMEGAKNLDQILNAKKVNHRLDLVDGSHCAVDLNQIAAFIMR